MYQQKLSNGFAHHFPQMGRAMADRGIGDNGGPPLENAFNKRRWAEALFATPNKPTGAVAMGFMLFLHMDAKGEGAAISDAEFMCACNVSDKACRNFKSWLVKAGFVKVSLRGYRGYRSKYQALIPEPNTGMNGHDYRNAIPVKMPEKASSIPVLDTGIVISEENSPHTPLIGNNNIKQTTTTTTVEQDAEGGGGGFNFDVLNGTAVDLAGFIAKHNFVDQNTARNMLANNVRTFGAQVMMEAFSTTIAQMPSGCIARPYPYLIETARKIRDGRQGKAKNGESKETMRERTRRFAEEAEEKLRRGVKP
jgi:hypothetical protein